MKSRHLPSLADANQGLEFSSHGNRARDGLRSVLRRHLGMIAACIVVTLASTVLYTFFLATPVYEATSVLRFEPDQVNLPQLLQRLSTENRVSTEIAVLGGRSAAAAVIDSLGLRAQLRKPGSKRASQLFSLLKVAPSTDTLTLTVRSAGDVFSISNTGASRRAIFVRPGDTVRIDGVTFALSAAATRVPEVRLAIVSPAEANRSFRSSLKVSRPARDADLIEIRYRSADPVVAAAVANILAQQLISGRQEVQLARTGNAVEFLKDQIATLGPQLRSVEDSLSSYRESTGVVDVPEQARTGVGRLAQIEADRGAIVAERDALAALVTQMRADSGRTGSGRVPTSSIMSFPTLFRNQATAQLLAARAAAENDRAALLIRRTPQDPDVEVLSLRIDEINSQLQGVAETYLQGLSNQAASLDALAGRFEGALSSLPRQAVQAARLERRASVLQGLFTMMMTRLKEAEITQSMKDPSVNVVEMAVVPELPVRPDPFLNLALGLIFGLAVGVTASVVWDLNHSLVRSRADALTITGVPVIGAIPRAEVSRSMLSNRGHRKRLGSAAPRPHVVEPVASLASTDSSNVEAVRRIAALLITDPALHGAYAGSFSQLHMNLALTFRDRPSKVLVITSPLPGEGKTVSSINFALAGAAAGLNVLLIDADFRRGLVNEVFGTGRGPGFAELLLGSARFEDVARRVSFGTSHSVTFVPTGSRLANLAGVQTTERLREVFEAAAAKFDLVVVDSPPANLLADAAVLGSAADAVILIVRAGHTRADALRYAIDQLTALNAPIIGTVLNDIDLRRHIADDDSYRYMAAAERYYAPLA